MKGNIITLGNKAITIQDKHDRQYRADIDTIDNNISEQLSYGILNIKVFFKVDKSISYGKSSKGKRYEAYDVNSYGPYGQIQKYISTGLMFNIYRYYSLNKCFSSNCEMTGGKV